ncbi:hypothetical protein HK105_202387 [Polyrhizophydium stewartii]|uniref:Enhancer of rudimentary homolog n=1 Tax=Polyrhizophydium stewartii TaxID=2732419 RepID=A0ABR4NEM4_9FUNG|nr:hypothetical protein HK105_004821 [Polyrhizophydium stewartii]
MNSHTILLLQAETHQRVWADFATVQLAMDELILHFEESLRKRNPSKQQVRYDVHDFNKFIDTTPDVVCLVYDDTSKAYIPHDKEWIKKQAFRLLQDIATGRFVR